jgi:hypothetical protein
MDGRMSNVFAGPQKHESAQKQAEVLERDIYYSTILKANEEKNAEMGCFKRLKRAGNCKTVVVRGRLCLGV